jgi:TolA-binding protein
MAIIKFSKKHELKEDHFIEWLFNFRAKLQDVKKTLLIAGICVALVAIMGGLFYSVRSKTNQEANALFGGALLEYQQGKYSNALVKFKQVMDNYSGSNSAPKAVFLYGSIYYDLGNYSLAIEAFKTYIEKYSSPEFLSPAVYKGLGSAYMQIKDLPNAIEAFQTAINKFPDDFEVPELRYKLARCLVETDKPEAAKEQLGLILKDAPASFYAKEAGLLIASL